MKRLALPLVGLVALVLAVGASGRATATTTITVNIMGSGTVTSSPGGIKCGGGEKKCTIAYSDTGTVELTAKPGSSWDHGLWDGQAGDTDCAGGTSTPCTITLDGSDHYTTANFTKSSGTTLSTLTVTYTDDDPSGSDDGDGNVSGPERTGGSEVDCGSAPAGTDCTWTVLTGSTVTVFETPDTGDVFTGWGGACAGTADSCTVRLDEDKNVSAAWTAANDVAVLTVSITGSGKVNGGGINCPSSCVATVKRNSAVTLQASPGDGQIFTGWSSGCTGTATTCTVTMDGDTTVTAAFAPANTLSVNVVGNGNVSGGSGAINCGNGANICSANFTQNATVTLVASPAAGATFGGWTGTCGGTATTCTVSMSQSKSVTATFLGGGGATTGFSLTVAVTGNGTVSGGGINCGNGNTTCTLANRTANSTLTLTATPSTGATFAGWGGGTCTGTATTCTVTFNSSKTVTATFTGGTANVQLTVSVSGPGRVSGGSISCGNGATTCTQTTASGSTITLTAAPASGARFAGWGGSCSGTATTCSVAMTASKSVSATFTGGTTAPPGQLTITVSGRGTVATSAGACTAAGPTKSCIQRFKAGAKVSLAARPSAGQSFLGWGGVCAGTKLTCSVTLATAQTVTANFTARATQSNAALARLGPPVVRKTKTGYLVTLRFTTTVRGVANVRGIRAGRAVTSISLRVAAGRATIGPFPVKLSGFYDFQVRLAGRLLHMPACLGACGRAAPPPPFLLVREAPDVTRTGDVWSVTLRARSNVIYDGRVRAARGTKVLVNQHFLGRATRLVLGPFLLGPGNYTLKVTGLDAYGRRKTLTWIVSLHA